MVEFDKGKELTLVIKSSDGGEQFKKITSEEWNELSLTDSIEDNKAIIEAKFDVGGVDMVSAHLMTFDYEKAIESGRNNQFKKVSEYVGLDSGFRGDNQQVVYTGKQLLGIIKGALSYDPENLAYMHKEERDELAMHFYLKVIDGEVGL